MAAATEDNKAVGGKGGHRRNTQQSNRGDSGGWGSHKALAFNLKFKGGRLEYKGESISLDFLFLLVRFDRHK
jgi:hypothetical protein